MVLPDRMVRKLQSGGTSTPVNGPKPMPQVVPQHRNPMVPDGDDSAVTRRFEDPPEFLHIALVVPDLKTYKALREHCYIIKPHELDTPVKVHFLLGRNRTPTELVLSHALLELGLVAPRVTNLQYPEEIELGWEE